MDHDQGEGRGGVGFFDFGFELRGEVEEFFDVFLMSFWRCSRRAFFEAASGTGGSISSRSRREDGACGVSSRVCAVAFVKTERRKNAPTPAEATRRTLRRDGSMRAFMATYS